MHVKKTSKNLFLLSGHTKVPVAKKGGVLDYKYAVVKGDNNFKYEDIAIDSYGGITNRALKIPEN